MGDSTVSDGGGMMYGIERLRPEDWARYRELRLQMLRDTPIAYLETYEDALAEPDSEWQFRARRTAAPGSVGVVAVAPDGSWVGSMGAYVPEPGAAGAFLVGVWVHPEHRGRAAGVADGLIDEVLSWARAEAGLKRMVPEVHESNGRAIAFYERRGFAATGVTIPYPLDPATREVEMALDL